MGIIATTPKPPTLTDMVDRIKAINGNLYRNIDTTHRELFRSIWENKVFSPKDILGAFGTDAVSLFILSQGLQSILSQANPAYVPLVAPKPVTINADGSVTVGD